MTSVRLRVRRVATAFRILSAFVGVRWLMARHLLPDIVHVLGTTRRPRSRGHHPVSLGRAVVSVLRVGNRRARCLVTALVLYRLLREEGYEPALVIGIPEEANTPMAHAWIELSGHDVGPPPGKGVHRELIRFSWPARERRDRAR